jgi:hypothetical protein
MPAMQPPLCHRTLHAPEQNRVIGNHAAPAMGGAPCIGPGCSMWLKRLGPKGQEINLGCGDALLASSLVALDDRVTILAQVAAAWHNDRIAETPGSKGEAIGESSAPAKG